jgi:hypothetical protein
VKFGRAAALGPRRGGDSHRPRRGSEIDPSAAKIEIDRSIRVAKERAHHRVAVSTRLGTSNRPQERQRRAIRPRPGSPRGIDASPRRLVRTNCLGIRRFFGIACHIGSDMTESRPETVLPSTRQSLVTYPRPSPFARCFLESCAAQPALARSQPLNPNGKVVRVGVRRWLGPWIRTAIGPASIPIASRRRHALASPFLGLT